MKFHFPLFAFLFSAFFFFSSCSGNKNNPEATDTTSTALPVHIYNTDNGKTFHVKSGDTFYVTLNECVGCAQVWTITAINNDQIEVLPNTYSRRSCTDCNGGSQDNTFNLKAKAPGSSALTLSYFDQKVTVTIEAE
ncbi:hypothetical protein BH11BAC7_BH11BAC7_27820 [soil metagenome]